MPAPGRADFASANLTPASRRQDHTTSQSAASICRQRALRSLTGPLDPPFDHVARPTLPRPPHPAPRPGRSRYAPLGDETARDIDLIMGWSGRALALPAREAGKG